jgi:hypothetical protein
MKRSEDAPIERPRSLISLHEYARLGTLGAHYPSPEYIAAIG